MLSALPGLIFFIILQRDWKLISGAIFYMLLFSFLGDNLSYLYARYVYPNNYPIINSWHFSNLMLVLYYFYLLNHISRIKIYISASVFFLGSLFSLFFFKFTESNTVLWAGSNIIIIVYCLVTYLKLLENSHYNIYKLPVFWIVTALLIFNSVTLFSFLFFNYLIFVLNTTYLDTLVIVIIIQVANTLKNFTFFYSLVLLKKGHPPQLSRVTSL